MNPIYLLAEDFYCHKKCEIDFTTFNSACIVGKAENNDQRSNGIGKSKIFTAITYALFNKTSLKNIENCIRHGADRCRVVFIFEIDNCIWKIIRSRPRKGAAELLLFEKDGSAWIPRDERTQSQMEKELFKIIKMNYETFKNSALFAQNDIEGLATFTPGAKKELLRETLQLQNYKKLEEITKKHIANKYKEQEKRKTIFETLSIGNYNESDLDNQLAESSQLLSRLTISLKDNKEKLVFISEKIINIEQDISSFKYNIESLDKNVTLLSANHKSLVSNKTKIINRLTSIKDESQQHIDKINSINEKLAQSTDIDITIDYQEKIKQLVADVADHKNNLNLISYKLKEINKPLPGGPTCTLCNQTVSDEYQSSCQHEQSIKKQSHTDEFNKVSKSIAKKEKEIDLLEIKKENLEKYLELKKEILSLQENISKLKVYFEDYNQNLSQNKKETAKCELELNNAIKQQSALDTSAFDEKNKELQENVIKLNKLQQIIKTTELEFIEASSQKKVTEDRLLQLKLRNEQKIKVQEEIITTDIEINNYQSVAQAFGPKGIPTLIIHNMLDDLQTEANNIICEIKSGIQLKFEIDKENSKGEQTDTLDILFYKDGMEHEWGQLSGAQQLCIALSLRIAMSFILQKNYGIEIKFILLDEIDASLDKETIELWFDMIKVLEKSFKVVLVTHNDSLKHRFTHAISVVQDQQLNSTTTVVCK